MAVDINITLFWEVTPFRLVEWYKQKIQPVGWYFSARLHGFTSHKIIFITAYLKEFLVVSFIKLFAFSVYIQILQQRKHILSQLQRPAG
jgi:hypothetical protein